MVTLVSPAKKRALLRVGLAVSVCGITLTASGRAAIPSSVDELLESPSSQRAAYGPAELSILCERDLPGEQQLDAASCLAALDRWTDCVRAETEKRIAPNAFRGIPGISSVSHCKAQALVDVVHDLIGANSHLASLEGGTFEEAVAEGLSLDPRDLFLSGMLNDPKASSRPTSVTMPWLYLAVGRRLGYPLRLAAQDGRLLLRWEGQDEQFTIDWQQSWAEPAASVSELRFRVEQPGREPLTLPSDQPPSLIPASTMHLLTADDELAVLLNARGACWESHGQNTDALVSYAQAHQLSPDCENYLVAIARVMPKISSLFGHTEPMAAPDYSDRGGVVEEVNAFNRHNLQKQEDDDSSLREVMEENKRILKAREAQRNSRP
jgi:hypothetical protein